MRNIICGGTKVISHLDEKRKRFPTSFPFRRRAKPPSGSGVAFIALKSPIVLDDPEAVASPEPAPPAEDPAAPAMRAQAGAPVPPAPAAPAAPAPPAAPAAIAAPAAPASPASPAAPAAPAAAVIISPPVSTSANAPTPADDDKFEILSFDDDIKSACTLAVVTLFPNICPDYLQETSENFAYDYESIVSHILDKIEEGPSYPRRSGLKRKRTASTAIASTGGAASDIAASVTFIDEDNEMDEDEKADRAIKLFGSEERREKVRSAEYTTLARTLCQQTYPIMSMKSISSHLQVNNNCLLPALLSLDSSISEKGLTGLAFHFNKYKTKRLPQYAAQTLPATISSESVPAKKEALEEYQAALKILELRKAKREAEKQQKAEDEANFSQAQQEGTAKECECCFGDFAMNRMVHCDGSLLHWFCKNCARSMAENQIGLSKYSLACMSMEGCIAGFSVDQRGLFLDKKTTIALERIEQEHVLRLAGIENLETCPFCPFAAEYPPVEVNKEFICQNSECETISCRLCRKETHIPKTCAEVERENGPSVRLTIEEAMSAAMIRNCNKCSTPFIKEQGCNKMTCTRAGCSNVQCYVCHESCDYSHFDDTTRGGKKGNCPLFESAEERHEEEVTAAEAMAREKLVQNNPGLDPSLLKIQMSEKVVEDEKRRKNDDQERQAARR